jgi:xanthine dehydrogenase YagS FAD-binding subunit
LTFHFTDVREIAEAQLWLNRYWGKPAQPLYYSPRTVEEALSLLENYRQEAKIIAGGIDLLGLMKNKVLSPRVLINIKALGGLSSITEDSNGVEIGALTGIHEIETSDLVRNRYPLLAEAAQSVGSPQIRNMATLGGNLCQEVRCWYYRRSPVTGISYHCRRKREDGICYAVNGENENHAILGESECFAVSPSDMSAGLQALDARIKTVSPRGERTIPLGEFYTHLGNVLQPDEIITAIHVPDVSARMKQTYMKFRVRKTIDFAIVSVAAAVLIEGNIIRDARIVIGGVSPAPYEASKVKNALKGETLTEKVAETAASESVCDAMPLRKNGYKVPIVKALVKRALLSLKV